MSLPKRPLRDQAFPKQLSTKALAIALALCCLGALSCGKRKPPLPPNERVVQRAEVSGFQRGNLTILSWRMPLRNAPAESVLNIDRIDIYRLAEPLTAPQNRSEEEFASTAIIISTIKVNDTDFGGRTMTYRDALQFSGQPIRLRYAIRFVNASGQKAAFSNFYLLEPASRVANPPTSLSSVLSQDAVELTWNEPVANIDGSTPANIIGFNVYRSGSSTEAAKLLNTAPVTETQFADRTFEFTKEYFYFVRTISLGTGGESVESGETQILSVKPIDTFPPSAPTAITLAATPTSISLFFATNPERDIAGYRIYRSTERDRPLETWDLLTTDLLRSNTFLDQRVEAGKTYFYYLTATDIFNNVSARSEIASETVPE
ncbi:MAG: hypothetical protein JNK51_08835 [Blastocatellia bacterium]|nr:hypothetical protein [Chloracidobacterium sp.]MBL8185019.1 hypothetical protein [Blastocatellia bacterium]HRJ89474.1 hypothetical protein [Pyrinomonadaceae bacterium]HRK50665.1 hypothetical protein [Pyrinomonadaceae bacterium]